MLNFKATRFLRDNILHEIHALKIRITCNPDAFEYILLTVGN